MIGRVLVEGCAMGMKTPSHHSMGFSCRKSLWVLPSALSQVLTCASAISTKLQPLHRYRPKKEASSFSIQVLSAAEGSFDLLHYQSEAHFCMCFIWCCRPAISTAHGQ